MAAAVVNPAFFGKHVLAGALLSGLSCFCEVSAFECLIEPAQTVELASPVTGLLDRVYVKRADRVSKGQVLARLESKAEEAAAEIARFKSVQEGPKRTAEYRIEFARRKFDRRQVLAREQLMPLQERDDAEAELRLGQAELIQAEENRELGALEYRQQQQLLELRSIRSPFDGVVLDQMVYPGEVVEPSSNRAILKIVQLDPLKVRVIVPKEYFGRIDASASVEVVPESPASGRYSADIESIDRLVDAASGTFVVTLEMSNPDFAIPAGIKCRAGFPGVR